MPEITTMPEIVWDGDIAVLADPDSVRCDNPFEWTPVQMDEVPLAEDDQ